MAATHRISYKGIAGLLILIIAVGISAPDVDSLEPGGCPDAAPGWYRMARDGFTKWISSGMDRSVNGGLPDGGSSAGGSRLDRPDIDMDDTGIPPGRTIHAVFSLVRVFRFPKSHLPPSAPANPIYKPPESV